MKEFDILGEDSDEEEKSETESKDHINISNVPRLTQAERNKQKRRKIHEATVKKIKETKLLKNKELNKN